MTHGGRRAEGGEFNEFLWSRDGLPECSDLDAMWGFAIRAAETWRSTDWESVNDPILKKLLKLSIFDWTDEGGELPKHARVPMMMSSLLASRILPRILAGEKKVFRWLATMFNH